MAVDIKRAKKKPVEIEFVLVTGWEQVDQEIVAWINANNGEAYIQHYQAPYPNEEGELFPEIPHGILVQTAEGMMFARVGDRIIRGTQGEFYPIFPKAFADSYEEIA